MSTKRTGKSALQLRPPVYRIPVLLSILIMVLCKYIADALIEKDGTRFLTDNSISRFNVRRYYKFYSVCSGKHIEIIGSSVTALGNSDSPNANLILQSAHYQNHHGIHIVGVRSGRFLCFNKKSKLITRFSGGSPRCIFEEQFSPEYFTTLKSVYNKNWSIGFNRKGKPLLGSDKSKSHRNRCFYFTKRDHSYLDGLHETNPYGPKIANPHKLMHFLHEKEIKRRKRHSLNKTKQ